MQTSTSPARSAQTLTTPEWSRLRRIGLCLAKRLVREAADKGQLLPDGSRVVRLGSRYRILAA